MGRKIFISGASRGIGKALALAYAGEGVILGLLSRNRELLEKTAQASRQKKATVYTYVADVRDYSEVKNSVHDFLQKAQGIDLVIANAGIATGPSQAGLYSSEKLSQVIETNTCGAIYLINEFLPTILQQKKGQLVAISSVAAYLPFLPGSYAASKIALNYFMEGLRTKHETAQIRFTVICPGYILTDMTSFRKNLPFALPLELAVRKIQKAIEKGKTLYIFPFPWKWIILLSHIVPKFLIKKILK